MFRESEKAINKQLFSRSDANYWCQFAIFRHYQKVFLLCQLHIRDVITWLIVIICQRARFSFIPCLEADIPRGHNLFSKYAWHIYQSKNTQELIKESIVHRMGHLYLRYLNFLEIYSLAVAWIYVFALADLHSI